MPEVTKKTNTRKPRRPLSDEERITFVLERYAPLRRGESRKEIKEIAAKYGRQPAVVQRAINEAFARRLVDIVRLKFSAPTRLPQLEHQILERFPKLHMAIVVEVGKNHSSRDEGALFGDKIHQELGKAVAELIGSNTVIDDNDVIGIGSGRGVFSVLKALTHFDKVRAQNVTAISLTGDVYARSHSYWQKGLTSARLEGLNYQLDADDHLSILGMSFLGALKQMPLSRSIAWAPGELIKMVKQTVLDREEWEKHIPDIGIVGVGVLSEGHRFYEEVKSPPNEQQQRLTPIIGDLRTLTHRIEELSRNCPVPNYVPVADICNRLFYVKPPAGVRITREQETQIVSLIASINDKLLTATEKQLSQIRRLILVAGTEKKALAINQLLEEDKFNIRIVCIDQSAAVEILKPH